MKKYLVCSYGGETFNENFDSRHDAHMRKAEFQNFSDAVAQYLLYCTQEDNAILADIEKQSIMRQYAVDQNGNVCIF